MTTKFIGSGYPSEGSKYYTTAQADSLISGKSDTGHTHAGYQATNSNLTALSGLTGAADKLAYFTGSGAMSTTDITSTARTLLGNSTATTMRATLGVSIGSNVQAWDADLDAIAALSGTSGFLKKTGSNTWSLDTSTYLTTAAGAATYQPIDSDLTAVAALSTTGLVSRTGTGTFTTRSISSSWPLSVSNGDGISGNPSLSLTKAFFSAVATATQSIANATSVLVELNDDIDQSQSILYYANANGALVTEPGYYEISGMVPFAANTSGYRQAGIYILDVDGVTYNPVVGSVVRQPASSVSAIHTIVIPPVLTYVAGGEYIQIRAYQNSGGALLTSYSGTTGYAASITIKRIG